MNQTAILVTLLAAKRRKNHILKGCFFGIPWLFLSDFLAVRLMGIPTDLATGLGTAIFAAGIWVLGYLLMEELTHLPFVCPIVLARRMKALGEAWPEEDGEYTEGFQTGVRAMVRFLSRYGQTFVTRKRLLSDFRLFCTGWEWELESREERIDLLDAYGACLSLIRDEDILSAPVAEKP